MREEERNNKTMKKTVECEGAEEREREREEGGRNPHRHVAAAAAPHHMHLINIAFFILFRRSLIVCTPAALSEMTTKVSSFGLESNHLCPKIPNAEDLRSKHLHRYHKNNINEKRQAAVTALYEPQSLSQSQTQ